MMVAGPTSVAGGTRIHGAFMRHIRVRPTSPLDGATNTSTTATLAAMLLDPLKRTGAVKFELDKIGAFSSPYLQTSSAVSGVGWADTPISWASSAIDNQLWSWRARSSGVKVGAGPSVPDGRYSTVIVFAQAGGAGVPRALYLYENKGIESRVPAVGDYGRALYLYVNKGIEALSVLERSLYLYVNKKYVASVAGRALYLYENKRDGEVFPYLNHLSPIEQYVGGQVSLYGDGFGQYLEARASATLSVSSTNGGNVAGNVRDGTVAEWQSTSGASAWIRFTWGAAKRIVAIALEGATNGTTWGVPQFRFDDASSQNGSPSLPAPDSTLRTTEYPVGANRTLYTLATPKVSTYVEIAIASGGSGTNRGLSEVWILEEIVPAQDAETARAVLNRLLAWELAMGIVSWQNRSPNWYPANSGVSPTPAAVVTVPTGAVSGLVVVEEST